jgi:S1-C subfamily serine protease
MQSTKVTLYSDDREILSYSATIVGTYPSGDLAVLSIDAPASVLRPIRVGRSSDLRIGQSVYAIGNPSGLSWTQTCGIVSGLNRSIPSPAGLRIAGVIQTDAPINAGASYDVSVCVGGPPIDA